MLLQHWQQLGADPIPRHPVAQVQGESGLSRSAFYKRMAQAGIRPICAGQHSSLEPIHLQALRELAQFLANGRHPEDFPGRLQPSPELAVVPSPQPVLEQLELEVDSEEDQEAPEELVPRPSPTWMGSCPS